MNIRYETMAILFVILSLLNYLNKVSAITLGKTHKKTINNPEDYKQMLNKLITQLDMDFTKYWLYKDLYNQPEHIGVTPERVQKALANLGDERRLKQMLINALNGQKIELIAIAGSITKGAPFSEEGKGYRIYLNAIRNWWNWVFTSITSSRMISKSVSIGGVGTDYFSYCLNSHIKEDAQPKMFLWELSANDRGRFDDKPFPSGQPLEQFTRNIIQRPSKPALLHLHFFRGHDYMEGKCLNSEQEGATMVAKHYRITSISWRNFVCDSMKGPEDLFRAKHLFARDKLHPSILGHAQMAFLVINHIKNGFLRMLRHHALYTPSISIFQDETARRGDIQLSSILFHETTTRKPLCFTYFKYNEYEPNNTLPVEIVRHDDFSYNIFKKFKIRQDKLGGMQTTLSEQLLQMSFSLPTPYSKFVITTHSQTGNGRAWIDKNTPVVIETQNYTMGTKVELVTTNLSPGKHTLNVLSMHGGFAVCSLAVL